MTSTEQSPADSSGSAGSTGSPGKETGHRQNSLLEVVRRRLRAGELGSASVIVALAVIWAVFESLDTSFLSPRNLSNLSVDIVGTGLIAVGVVFVLLVGEIDLSVASVSALAAALFAAGNVQYGIPEVPAVLLALAAGAAVGAIQGFLVARVGVPSFVVTLAGLLGWNGLTLYIFGGQGSIILDDGGLVVTLTHYYFHDVAVAYGLAALGTAAYFLLSYRNAQRRRAIGALPAQGSREIVLRTLALAAVSFAAAWTLNQFLGLPLALLIFLTFLVCLDLLLRRTTYGRRIFALGGSVEPARRAGIAVVSVRVSVFMISSTMAAIGGLFLASRITSASETASSGNLLMQAIAAAVIGGTSLFGGRGRTWSALLGILVIQSIASGMALLGIPVAVQLMITGVVLLAAVIIDTLARRTMHAHGLA
ncbi:sugar ABC transporter permease [Streptomyces spirodelae]|uniref:Xylose transport system permease protein XylH n=1 Tax=Streptomyces spirodelae TaxID=2812904 RepID=A0ABS3WW57_9ACTN|nr:sugar ABC transporter permease [Streptomyces spirodelae]MBO8187086.1 sugar ABC transporter permease [Streptomyces spirodelae]